MTRRIQAASGAGLLGLLVTVGFGVWDRMEARQAAKDRAVSDLSMLADHEARICALENGKWWRGDCVPAD